MPKKANDIVVVDESAFEKIYYVKNDPKQRDYILCGITVRPGGSKLLHLDYMGKEIEVFDNEVSDVRDELKYMENKYNGVDEDDDE